MVVAFLRRTGVLVLTLAVASLLVFLLLAILPGDIARTQLGLDATETEVEALREELGLNRPAPVRYLTWVAGLLRGDMGISYASRTPVAPQVFDALQVSLILVTAGILVAVVVALPLGTLAALRHGRPTGAIVGALSQVGIAVPSFVAGLLLVAIFAVGLGWLPSGGWVAPADDLSTHLRHLVLPALALGLVRGAILARYTRAAVLDIQREDFMRTARAKGLTSGRAMVRHGIRNALIPVVTVTGVEFSALIVGAVVIETVFVLPGLGSLLLRSVANRDLIQVQAIVMVIVALVLLVNFLVDLAHTAIDPRLRRHA
nr:ABC transporter permease [Actinomycetales bacterium]